MNYPNLTSMFPDFEEENETGNEAVVNQLLKMERATVYRPDLDCLFIKTEEIEYDISGNYKMSFTGNYYICGLFLNNYDCFAIVFFNFKSILESNLDLIRISEKPKDFEFNLVQNLSTKYNIKDSGIILDFIASNDIKIPIELMIEALISNEIIH